MSPPDSSARDTSVGLSNQIDLVCDQFEAALRNGAVPQIEEFLARCAESGRNSLLLELVALELDYLKERGETVSFGPYFQRFPAERAALENLQTERELHDADDMAVTVPPAGSGQAPVILHDSVIGGVLRKEAAATPGDFDVYAETIAGKYSPEPSEPPRKIKQFQLQTLLGQGAFGVVWKARDLLLRRDVAIKLPRKEHLQALNVELFLREARAAAKLRHPNIVAIHEVGKEHDEPYIVSDFIDGLSLKEWLKTHRPSSADVAMLVAKLAVAVQHAHERGIIHRDLKPANVLLDQRGEPHIADFGLAKREAHEDSLAFKDQVVGTPGYMAPEQAACRNEAIDRRTDVYALGAILYELLTGRVPFTGPMDLLLHQIQSVAPVPPRQVNSHVPRDLEAICLKCLAKESPKRYGSAAKLADDLHLFVSGETLRGIPTPVPYRVQKWFKRKRRLVLVALPLILAVAGATAWIYPRIRPPGVKLVESKTREVEFQTSPSGCEITVVAIDPDTGEPDPNKIEHAAGLTSDGTSPPLTMKLEPGDYLVVAVWKDNPNRFHEVLRYVSAHGELPTRQGSYRRWEMGRKERSNVVVLNRIVIPLPDIISDMAFVEVPRSVVEPLNPLPVSTKTAATDKPPPPPKWRVTDFWVDLKEQRSARDFDSVVSTMEVNGKRLPTAAELYYLTHVACPALTPESSGATASETQGTPDAVPAPECSIRGKIVGGLHSGNWEWTSTRPGGPCTGTLYSPEMPFLGVLRMVGAGASFANELPHNPPTATGMHWQSERNHELPLGVRGVRSAKPRRMPEDFVRSQ